ncbi:2-succinyl-5-enolpyruvyl-6-hydroxy-3-cyclohexene-1-carboxylate synthase [Lysinibacillus alkalisoli]|uniref:2-succinyl-5-enolpyruvyl-6-hydroxy-3-cyclohexene-1-carboxylate synthase n=1 Tax=Lysinibacillus alkalisoli TaxID=1911548 RepID=A0A917G9B8_9BACI|nr:2-succinyl-5-enolpyruvyl-6-hydroxy-3-cyclohexene-1-carboxylic-acid synthase [Lysinibacillus alkalisoli]GGG30470.1 2-succinyl-5-enolpyruvyl-6-hydroxy-3-cyclohexene-1-carboxylate synthase [Lysinibacillus alkalisoli]
MNEKRILSQYVYKMVATLVKNEVVDVVISPGSRSTPLAYAFAATPMIKVYRQVDERSAGFFALGLAKAQAKPVVLLCTSGTAAANYYPAIVEAHYARVPLIVITADRPHELREVGAPQAINQPHLFGEHVKWSVDFPIPDDAKQTLPFIERHLVRAINTAYSAPYGPVHINVPFREPLLIEIDDIVLYSDYQETFKSELVPTPEAQYHFGKLLRNTERGLLIIGELPLGTNRDLLWSVIRRLKWPVLIEPLSNMRRAVPQDCMSYVITTYDALLKVDAFKAQVQPETVVRFGAQPISKFVMQFIAETMPEHYIVVDESSQFRDAIACATHVLQAELTAWLEELTLSDNEADDMYLAKWQEAHTIAKQKISQYEGTDEGAVVADILKNLPNGSDIFVSNSMPIRDIDTFFLETTKDIKIYANRGANGIDGIISTALGMSATTSRPMHVLIGDLALLHDSNGFIATRYQQCQLTTIVLNNDGGGIFSYLPQAQIEPHYEDLFGTPTALTFESLAALYEMHYEMVNYDQLQLVNFHEQETLMLLEVTTNRKENVAAHRALWAQIAEAIE